MDNSSRDADRDGMCRQVVDDDCSSADYRSVADAFSRNGNRADPHECALSYENIAR